MKKVALVTIHGMGKTDSNYADDVIRLLRKRLGEKAIDVAIHTVFY